ncbi:hypothetical protein EDD17DRAFT_1631623 [Pisolithus thermaeus]|nr:hypothetical protein EDD17DRAFT_1631623 [Pisolithus thermaeus]
MSHSPALLGLRRTKTEGKAEWDYGHQFLTYQGVTIVDDMNDYQLFSDCLFIAPQEEALERFYASLGCNYVSAAVKEQCNGLREIPATETCSDVQSLILKRLPLFIQNYTDARLRVTIPSSSDHLKVKACNRILVSKILVAGNVKRIQSVRATARSEGDFIELRISEVANGVMYEVAASLCRVLYGVSKMNATVLFGTILSADSEFLELKGFPCIGYMAVNQISQQHANRYGEGNKAMTKRLAGSSWPANQSMLDTQRIPQLSFLQPPRSAHPPSRADSVSWKIHTTCNVSNDKCLDTAGHFTSLPCLGPVTRAEASQYLNNAFCRVPADITCLHRIGQIQNIQVCVDEDELRSTGIPDAETFMKRMDGPLARFVDVILTLSEVYNISATTLRVFYDVSGGRIAFNYGGTIYLNLRYFEIWHDEQVKTGNRQNARMSWFLALAHEIAHNLTDQHNSDHEFWFSAICEAHLVAFSQFLQPANICTNNSRCLVRLRPPWILILCSLILLWLFIVMYEHQ